MEAELSTLQFHRSHLPPTLFLLTSAVLFWDNQATKRHTGTRPKIGAWSWQTRTHGHLSYC